MKRLFLLTILSVVALVAVAEPSCNIYHKGWIDFNKNGRKDIYEDPKRKIDERVEDLLKQMTVEEKTCQMVTLYGYRRVLKDSLPTERWKSALWKDGIANIDEMLNGVSRGSATTWDLTSRPELATARSFMSSSRNKNNSLHLTLDYKRHVEAKNTIQRWFIEQTRLGIPAEFTNEGIHGLNHSRATALPAPIGIGSTWNRDLVRRAGEIAGEEGKALGYHNIYAPILDVPRDARWGRVVECYGEDPYLVAELGIAMAKGVQSQGVASTLKHFAAYSTPKGGRDGECRTDPHITLRELHQIHLYPFRRVIAEAKPMGVMSSYNDYDGEVVTASKYFLTDLLRTEYGFDGYVVSDSQAVEFVHEKHCVAETYAEAVRQVVEAGLNVRTHFTKPDVYVKPLREIIADGRLPMSVVDERVREVLRVKFRLGLFDNPFADASKVEKVAGADLHRDFMLDIQQQSLVLLKNENNTLPLDRTKLRRVLVAGPLADESNYMISRYGPNSLEGTTIYEGIKNLVGKGVEVRYAKGCRTTDKDFPETELCPEPLTTEEQHGIAEAVEKAKGCDVIIVALGEDKNCVGECKSRTSLDLPGRQQLLLEALHATGIPVIVVLVNGRPLTINWADKNVAAILESWHPTVDGGTAIARTLFGDYNPGGKLSITFPRSIGQLEYNFPFKKGSHGLQSRKGPNGSGVTRVQGALYPFGYGLSYTTFDYSNLKVEQGDEIIVSCDVKNSGSRDGDEVVQLYVRDMYSSVVTYDSVLRGFERVTLKAGETKRVTFRLCLDDLSLLDRNMKWVVEKGDFELRIGASSEDIRLRKMITIK